MTNTALAELVRDSRERAGLTRYDVADATGLSYEYIRSIETDRKGIRQRQHIAALAHALGISPDAIYAAINMVPHDLADRLSSDPAAVQTVRRVLDMPTPD